MYNVRYVIEAAVVALHDAECAPLLLLSADLPCCSALPCPLLPSPICVSASAYLASAVGVAVGVAGGGGESITDQS